MQGIPAQAGTSHLYHVSTYQVALLTGLKIDFYLKCVMGVHYLKETYDISSNTTNNLVTWSINLDFHTYKFHHFINPAIHISRRRQWHPTPVILSGKSHGWRSLVDCSPWVAKSRTRLSDFTFTFHFHALEKEIATHSSVLVWRIPGTGEPGGLPSMGSHRVGHD